MANDETSTEKHLSAVPQDEHDPERYEIAARTGTDPGPLDEDGNRSFDDFADDEPTEAEKQAQMFPRGALDGDPDFEIGDLLTRYPLEFEVKIMGGKTGLRNGVIDPSKVGRAMVVHEVAKVELIPRREGEPGQKEIVAVVVRQHLRQTYVENLDVALRDPATELAA